MMRFQPALRQLEREFCHEYVKYIQWYFQPVHRQLEREFCQRHVKHVS